MSRYFSCEMSKGFTIFLGAAELAGGLGVILGVFTQRAAIGLILLMLGAIQKKIFVWHTGFWVRNKWMELRHDACRNELGNRHHRWRKSAPDEVNTDA